MSFCADLYPSEYKDWVHPQSILGVIVVMHSEIGELTRGNRLHSELLADSIFFYNALYKPRREPGGFGRLEPIALPSFDSPEWPLPDMSTTESFRAKLRQDFHSSMRPTTGSKQTHLCWFMPIGVFVDLFFIGSNMHRTKTMFVYKHASDELCASLMDSGWDSKVTFGADVLKTIVARDSLKFRYHISRSTLYANFVYNRHKMLRDNTWEALDQYEHVQTVSLHCEMGDIQQELEVGMSWTVHEVRQEMLIHFGAALNSDFDIWIVSGDIVTKIIARNEKNVTAEACLPPKMLRVILR